MKKRMNIGLLLCHMKDDFPSEVCRGAMMAAAEMDADLTVIPGRFLYAQSASGESSAGARERDIQYNTIFAYARASGIDALVVSTGTICRFLTMEQIQTFFAGFGDIPIVSLSIRVPGYPCIRIDEERGLTAVIEHLITAHGRRRFAFVGGPEGHQEADARLAIFRSTLERHGLMADESLICHGDFSRNDPNIERFLEESYQRVDAICFASDEMAFLGIRKLAELGVTVGEEISVTGYDDNLNTTAFAPDLTTASTNPSLLGYRGVLACAAINEHASIPSLDMPSEIKLRTSCGCLPAQNKTGCARAMTPTQIAERMTDMLYGVYRTSPTMQTGAEVFRLFSEELLREASDPSVQHISDARVQSVINLYIRRRPDSVVRQRTFVDVLMDMLQTARSLADTAEKRIEVLDIMTRMYREITMHDFATDYYKLDAARENGYRINDVGIATEKSFADPIRHITERMSRLALRAGYLYLYRTPRQNTEGRQFPPAEELLLKGYHIGGEVFFPPDAEQAIPRDLLFSNPFIREGRRTMVLTPLYCGDMHYGLLLLEIDYNMLYYLYNLTDKVSNALRLANAMRELSERMKQIKSANDLLDMLSKVDELTGIYNRRGFFDTVGTIIGDPERAGQRAFLMFFDLMRLKSINDEYGHDEGDLTIRTAAKTLTEVLGARSTVGRIGGDEFAALVLPEDGVTQQELISRVDERLRQRSMELQRGYMIQLSMGVIAFACDDTLQLKSLLMQADMRQYEDKQQRKGGR